MITIAGYEIDITFIMWLALFVAVAAGFIYRVWRARKRGGKSVKSETQRYAGRAMMRFDPITGAPINVVDKAAVVEYVEEHFEEGQNDETGIYGKEKTDF
jgi:hypothetical protein